MSNSFCNEIMSWVAQHPVIVGAVAMYVFSAMTQALPVPDEKSRGGYLFFFNFVHSLAANFNTLKKPGNAVEGARAALFIVMIFAVVGATAGCRTAAYQVHPGSVDLFDSQSYDTLLVAQATIQQAKREVQAGTLPATAVAPLNDSVRAYDVALAAWQVYHASGQNKAAAQAAIAGLSVALAELQGMVPAAAPAKTSSQTSPKGAGTK